MRTILKFLIEFVAICFCFTFCFLDFEACGILVPRLGIKPAPAYIGRQSLNHWAARKSLDFYSMWRAGQKEKPEVKSERSTGLD